MPPIPGSVRVGGFIAPTVSTDPYPVTEDTYNKGGYRVVADAVARLAITTERRKEGMLVYQVDTTEFYQLIGGIADINWTLVVFGGGSGPDNTLWSVNTVWKDTVATLPGPTQYMNGVMYFSPSAGTLLNTEVPYYRCDINAVANLGEVAFGREMAGVDKLMWWTATGFGVSSTGLTPDPGGDFDVRVAFLIGQKQVGACVAGAQDYICFEKKAGDTTLWASVSTAATGGDFFEVDTTLEWATDQVYKLSIIIDPVAPQSAEFIVDDVSVAIIDSGDVTWPDTTARPWQCRFTLTPPLALIPVLYQLPWYVNIRLL